MIMASAQPTVAIPTVVADRMLPFAAHFAEFAGGFNGTCTQTALSICVGAAKGRPATQDDMVWMTHDMLNKKLCGPNGASTLAAAAVESRDLLGPQSTLIEWDYGQPFGHNWQATLEDYAGVKPILLQLLNGQALHDAQTGVGDESGLHAHAVAVLGIGAVGVICADGDHPEVAQRFQVYTFATLTAAQPCGLLMLQTQWAHIPQGWTDDGQVLFGPNKVPVVNKFRALILGDPNWLPGNIPLDKEFTLTGSGFVETYQTFAFEEWRSRTDENEGAPFLANIGADLVKLRYAVNGIKQLADQA
jgi:hypothetical protein